MTTTQTELLMALHDAAVAAAIQVALANLGDRDNATRSALLAALQALDPPVEQPHLQFTAYHTDDTQAGTL